MWKAVENIRQRADACNSAGSGGSVCETGWICGD